MAHAINTGQVTPADELRRLLEINEKRLANLRDSGASVVDLLLDLDRLAALWPTLAAQGVDLRPEVGRWETLQAGVQRRARAIVQQVKAVGGFPAVRARYGRPADTAAWWWLLDQQVRAADRRRIVQAVRIAAVVLAVAVGLYVLLTLLFPVDPNRRAALDALASGERKITQQGDFVGAAADFSRATEAMPTDPEAWLRLGATLQHLGDTAGADAAFRQAQALLSTEAELRVSRAAIYITFGMIAEAEADLQVAERLAPDQPLLYFYRANIFEARQEYQQALKALEQANGLAEAQGQTELVAVIRYRLAMVMQLAQMQGAVPATPTPRP